MAKVTIEDISRQTGLSRGTVSRALNNRPDISENTKQRVLEACRLVKYVPSLTARALATGRHCAAAVLVDSLDSAFAVAVLRGASNRAAEVRYTVQAVEMGDVPAVAAERIRRLAGERIDVLVVAAPIDSALSEAVREGLGTRPLAACWPVADIACDLLTSDQVEAGRLAARCALRKDNRSVLYVHCGGSVAATDRLRGFQEVCREYKLNDEAVIAEVPADGPARARRLLDLEGKLGRARAIAAVNDYVAIELMAACVRAGRVPGRDVAVIGQGNERVGACIHPGLSTIDFAGEEIGRRAVDIALQRLDKVRMDAPQTIAVAPTPILRESTACLG
jgi:LacI family transcriptional regulator